MRRATEITLVAILAAVTAAVFAAPAAATNFEVTRTDDPVPDFCQPTDCSLREAVRAAATSVGEDRIELHPGALYELAIPNALEYTEDDDNGLTGDLDIDGGTVKISGDSDRPATIDANGLDRVLEVTRLDTAALSGVVLVGGHARTAGGGALVAEEAKLRLGKVTVSENSSDGSGAGLEVAGTLRMKNSTISGNTAATDGGGISVRSDGRLFAINSSIARNHATVSGGGLEAIGAAALNAVTIADNLVESTGASPTGGGVFAGPGQRVVVENSLIALNHDPAGLDDCGGGALKSDGDNLVSTDCAGIDFAGDLVHRRPRLRQLRDNGGATKTIALRRGSPALDEAGPQSSPRRDQRGVRRDKLPDIGAYERES